MAIVYYSWWNMGSSDGTKRKEQKERKVTENRGCPSPEPFSHFLPALPGPAESHGARRARGSWNDRGWQRLWIHLRYAGDTQTAHEIGPNQSAFESDGIEERSAQYRERSESGKHGACCRLQIIEAPQKAHFSVNVLHCPDHALLCIPEYLCAVHRHPHDPFIASLSNRCHCRWLLQLSRLAHQSRSHYVH